ncbi:MAG: hypothetical protein AABO57_25270 [Acidobacteriota bacterium]
MKVQSMSPGQFLVTEHRNIAATALAQRTIDRIEMPVRAPDAAQSATQVATFLQSSTVQQALSELQRLNKPIGSLQLDLSLKAPLIADAASAGVDLSPLFEALSTKREVKAKGDSPPRTVLQGVLLGGAVSCILNAVKPSGNPVLLTLGLMVAGGVLWTHVNSFEIGLNKDGSVSGKIGL